MIVVTMLMVIIIAIININIIIIIINIICIHITIVGTCERLLEATFGNFASVLELLALGLHTFGLDDQYHQVGNRKMPLGQTAFCNAIS